LTFITLDNKNWCKGIYYKGQLIFDTIPENLRRTWRYSHYLENRDIEYAYLYSQGCSISDVCPEPLKEEWENRKKRLNSFHSSFKEAKISLEDNCFFDLVPEQFLLEICETKTKIIDHVVKNTEKPKNYDLLLSMEKLISFISEKQLNLDLNFLKQNLHNQRARMLLEKVKKSKNIEYNLFGSKTGRLTTKPKTFPILNLDTSLREVIKPVNDAFVELDFNAAEARVLFGLSGQDQPQEDIHSWNAKKFNISREQAKKEIFSWLYGSTKIDNTKYEKLFNLDKVLDRFYDGEVVTTIYKRKIKSDNFHKLNYLVQSTSTDLVFEQVCKIHNLLKNKKSYISFLVHDSIVIDLAKEDKTIVNELVNVFSNTLLGTFPVNISIGKDYGSLRKI